MRIIFSKVSRCILAGGLTLLLSGCLDSVGETTTNNSAPSPDSSNTAPTISGNPDSAIIMGQFYIFTPSASDAEGNRLTFAVINLPVWASFSETTGEVSGTPQFGSVGVFSGISVSVSDGALSASLTPFSIEVVTTATGAAMLSWLPPTENEDGSSLSDLAGYNVYYGTSPNNYATVVEIDNPSISSYVVENLVPNTYYFVTTAVKSNGWESNYSEVGSKTIR